MEQRHFAARRLGEGDGVGRCCNRRLLVEKLGNPLGGACRQLNFAPHFRKLAKRTRGQDGVDQELAECSAGQVPGQHFARPIPEKPDDGAQRHEDDRPGQDRAGQRPLRRRVEGGFGRRLELNPGRALLHIGLHHGNGLEPLLGEGGGIRRAYPGPCATGSSPSVRKSRAAARPAGSPAPTSPASLGLVATIMTMEPTSITRFREQDRGGGRKGGLDLGGVGGEARDDFARFLGLVEAGIEVEEMAEEGVPDIGHHPLAQPVDVINPDRRSRRQRHDDRQHSGEILVDQRGVGDRKAAVDHPACGHRHDEGGGRRPRPGQSAPG